MKPIHKNLYQFTVYIPPMDFTIHQYLLASDPAILLATGGMDQARTILPQIREALKGKALKYIFVSHMESDECGGLPVFLKEYPNVTVICSELGARELLGYGYRGKMMIGKPDEILCDGELSLQFFSYPSEVHFQNGLVCYEQKSGIFYSADLMLRYGNAAGKIMEGTWKQEVSDIALESVPNGFMALKNALQTVSPEFIAVGHGYCVKCE